MNSPEVGGEQEKIRIERDPYLYIKAVDHAALRNCTDNRGEPLVSMQTATDLAKICEGWMFEMCLLRAKEENGNLDEADLEKAKGLQAFISSGRLILESLGQQNLLIVAEDTARERAEKKLSA